MEKDLMTTPSSVFLKNTGKKFGPKCGILAGILQA